MEYSTYKEAFDALVKDNDGVLPDLYESINYIIFKDASNLEVALTVADVVAHALVEMSATKPVVSPKPISWAIQTDMVAAIAKHCQPVQLPNCTEVSLN